MEGTIKRPSKFLIMKPICRIKFFYRNIARNYFLYYYIKIIQQARNKHSICHYQAIFTFYKKLLNDIARNFVGKSKYYYLTLIY